MCQHAEQHPPLTASSARVGSMPALRGRLPAACTRWTRAAGNALGRCPGGRRRCAVCSARRGRSGQPGQGQCCHAAGPGVLLAPPHTHAEHTDRPTHHDTTTHKHTAVPSARWRHGHYFVLTELSNVLNSSASSNLPAAARECDVIVVEPARTFSSCILPP